MGGGSKPNRLKKDVNPHGATAQDLAAATSYEKGNNGAREFKGGSPLATSKGSTLVAREGLLNQLKQKFGKSTNGSILNEENLLNDEENE